MTSGQCDGGADGLSDEVLLEIARMMPGDEAADTVLEELRRAERLARGDWIKNDEAAAIATLVVDALTRTSMYGLCLWDMYWVDREAATLSLKQLFGLLDLPQDSWHSSLTAPGAIRAAVNEGYVEERSHDTWQPGMHSGSGYREILAPTTYGMQKAWALAESNSKPPLKASQTPSKTSKPTKAPDDGWFYMEAKEVASIELSDRVFCKVKGRNIAERVARLLGKQHPSWCLGFQFISLSNVDPDDQLLIEHKIESYEAWSATGGDWSALEYNVPDQDKQLAQLCWEAAEWAEKVCSQEEADPITKKCTGTNWDMIENLLPDQWSSVVAQASGQPATKATLEAACDHAIVAIETAAFSLMLLLPKSKEFRKQELTPASALTLCKCIWAEHNLIRDGWHQLYEALSREIVAAILNGSPHPLQVKSAWGRSAQTYHELILIQAHHLSNILCRESIDPERLPLPTDDTPRDIDIRYCRTYYAKVFDRLEALERIDLERLKSELRTECANAVAVLPADQPARPAPIQKWTPPDGYVGANTICADNEVRFQKNGKSIPRTTLQVWVKRDNPKCEIAPDNGECHYPESWVLECMAKWNPRKRKQ